MRNQNTYRQNRSQVALAGLTLATLLSGCRIDSKILAADDSGDPKPATQVDTTASTLRPASKSVTEYVHSPDRAKRLASAALELGQQMVDLAKNAAPSTGYFVSYCGDAEQSTPNVTVADLIKNRVCTIVHEQSPGDHSSTFSADVHVIDDGRVDQVNEVLLQTAACPSVTLINELHLSVWRTSSSDKSSDDILNPPSLNEVRALDDTVTGCIQDLTDKLQARDAASSAQPSLPVLAAN